MTAVRQIEGLELNRQDAYTLRIAKGAFMAASNDVLIPSPTYIDINIKTLGLGGRVDPTDSPGCYQVYMLHSTVTGVVTAVVSKEISATPVYQAAKLYDPNLNRIRPLCFSLYYEDDAAKWGPFAGWMPFHLSGWPFQPEIRMTNWGFEPRCRILHDGTSQGWAEDIDYSALIPSGARLPIIGTVLRHTGGSGTARAWIRSVNDGNGCPVGEVAPGAPPLVCYPAAPRTTSANKHRYRVDGPGALSVYLLGYRMTDQY